MIDGGAVICEFRVPHRAIPWTPARVPKSGVAYKVPGLVAWQSTVAAYARVAMAGRAPYAGEAEVQLWFELARSRGSFPDLTNCVKSTEDALQGIVLVNDRQVVRTVAERRRGATNLATVRVLAATLVADRAIEILERPRPMETPAP